MADNLRTPSGKPGKRIPPLVWIVLAILGAWIVWWFIEADDVRGTPSDLPAMPQSEDPGAVVQAPYVPAPAVQGRPQVEADEARPDTAREAYEAGVDPAEVTRGRINPPASPQEAPQAADAVRGQ